MIDREGSHIRPSPGPVRLARGVRFRARAIADRLRLAELRAGRDVCWDEPEGDGSLVTVRITTYDRARLVVDRAIASAIAQTYRNLEILVVGDGATAETERAVRSIDDPRVRFVGLTRSRYPADAERRWLVVGHEPMTRALGLARGSWIAPLDDDDEFTDDHVERLLSAALERRLEFVYGRTEVVRPDGSRGVVGEWPLRYGGLTHGAVLYSSHLRFMGYDAHSWLDGVPADWNLWRRMRAAGVQMGFIDDVVYRYYPARHVPG